MVLNKIKKQGKNIIALIGILCMALSISIFGTMDISAETVTKNRGFTITPPVISVQLSPGETHTQKYNIFNDTPDHAYIGKPVVQLFTAGDDEGSAILLETNVLSTDQIKTLDWVTFSQDTYRLEPMEDIDIYVEFNVPEDLATKGHYFSIAFKTTTVEGSQDSDGITTSLREQIGTLAFMNVINPEKPATEKDLRVTSINPVKLYYTDGEVDREKTLEKYNKLIEKKDANKIYFDTLFDDVGIIYTLKVSGDLHMRPSGHIFVGDDLANPLDKIEINPDKKIAMPDQPRTFYILQPISEKIFGGQMITAQTFFLAKDGDGYETVKVETEAKFFPWKTIIVIIIIILSLSTVYYLHKQSVKKNKNTSKKKVGKRNVV